MKKRYVVFDASSILCWLHREEGYEKVKAKLYDEDLERCIYAVNLAELSYRLLQERGDYQKVQNVIDALKKMGVQFDFTMNWEIVRLASVYREKIKSAQLPISLGDCFGMAATQLKKADGNPVFLTTDANEFGKAEQAGLLPVKVDIISQPSKRKKPAPAQKNSLKKSSQTIAQDKKR